MRRVAISVLAAVAISSCATTASRQFSGVPPRAPKPKPQSESLPLAAQPQDSIDTLGWKIVRQSKERKSWSIAKDSQAPAPRAVLMSDSLYAVLSATPVDSLSDRQYDMLMRERQVRALRPQTTDPFATGFLVGLGVLAALFTVGLLLAH